MAELWLPGLGAFLLSVVATGLVRRYALATQLMDVPNARSSHAVSTPRGGGLGIVVACATVWGVTLVAGGMAAGLGGALLPAVLAVAGVGFWDDHRDVPARLRLLVHFVAIAWAVSLLGDGLVLPWPWGESITGWPVQLLAVVAMVWFLNLFNFMDGIDGIAASEALFVASAGAGLAALSGQGGIALACVALAGAAFGFLVWNWPPAKIFMGDVGSGFLGATLAVLGYAAAIADAAMLWPWIILVAVFVTDATITLGRRFLRGERWYAAHRSHAYQWASRRWGHLAVTLAVSAINVGWLGPLAYLTYLRPALGPGVAAAAYLPLAVLALVIGAGRRENAA